MTSYTWDDMDRLSGVTLPTGALLTMTYRFDDLLATKTGPQGSLTLLWDGDHVATGTGAAGLVTAIGASAQFLGTDATTQGNWWSGSGTPTYVYGSDGYNLIDRVVNYPSYATVTATGETTNLWSSSPSGSRALLKAPPGPGSIAADWYSNSSFSVSINLTDGKPHKVSLYCLDWNNSGLTQTISVVDAVSGAVLTTQAVSSFNNGLYLSWTLQGHVNLVFTNTNSSFYAAVSGLFFDPAPARAQFLGSDTSTQGNWRGVYGNDGYNIIEDAVSYPSYASLSETGITSQIWAASTTDVRALENAPPASGRIAANWNASSFSINLNLTDGKAHKVSVYCLDWSNAGITQSIAVQDAHSGAVLTTQNLASFNNGIYLYWTLQGHVNLVFTSTGAPNAVVSGLFFDSFALPPTGGYG